MRDQELEKKINDYIMCLYNAKYVGFMEVTKDDDIYSLKIGIPDRYKPTHISLQTNNPEEFLEYICKEFKERNYMRVYFYSIKESNNESK